MSDQMKVGDTFTRVRHCDKYRPIYYAAASGDFNPIHIDRDVGMAAGLGGPILQGLCTMAWAVEAFMHYLKDPSTICKVRVRFSKPVGIDDTLTYFGRVVAIEGGLVRAEISAKNQKDEEVLKGALVEARLN